ncbi:DUF2332 domain-containing protein [Nocardia sp. NPDC058499]|uniref:DUF2332 domain-containing protein n=1 Tax=Nocardia sp. NPDC058499 TaxID=3346530 RepID=UPI00364EC000
MNTAEWYRRFARLEAHGSSPLYELLSTGIAEDAEILALIDRLPEHKRQPNLVLGAARHHGGPADSYASFRTWVLSNWTTLKQAVLARSTQTNEAGRVAVLLPLLGLLRGRLSLIEVGASAGLCLLPDRYSYLYDEAHRIDPETGPSPVQLACATTGNPPLPDRLPTIAYRAGIDLHPLDVTDHDDMAWLDSLVWPEHHSRRERLHRAAAIAREEAPHLIRGDLNADIADLVRQAPADTTVVVFHSAVLNYLDADARAAFQDTVEALPCQWIANEGPGVLPNITRRLAIPVEQIGGRFVLSFNGRPVALTGGHGQTLDWIG